MEFRYVARNKKTGKRVVNNAKAQSVPALVARLKREGLFPLKIDPVKTQGGFEGGATSFFKRGRVRGRELAIFTRQVAATLGAGILLTDALETIAEDLDNTYFRNIINRIMIDIRAGEDFSTALSKHPKVFSLTYVSIVKSGEATGQMDKTLATLAHYLENTERMREKVKSTIRYPLFVFSFAVVVVMVIVLFLIPRFQEMYAQSNTPLPMLTRIIVNISQFFLQQFPYFILGLIILGIIFWSLMKMYWFRYLMDTWKLKFPILGKEIIHKSLLSRFCHTLGFLLAKGVGLARSLEITSQSMNHLPFAEAIEKIKTNILAGATISDQMKAEKIFPRLATKMCAVGEKSGTVTDMLERTGKYYDEELEISIQNLMVLIEPVLIIFIGGIVAVVVVALYLPIFKIAMVVR